jgi:hypothetical protein
VFTEMATGKLEESHLNIKVTFGFISFS